MPTVKIYLDPALHMDPAEVVQAWAEDAEAAALLAGSPGVGTERRTQYHFDVVNVVLLPLAVNLAGDVLVVLVKKVLNKVRRTRGSRVEAELLESEGEDRIVAVTDQPTQRPGPDDDRD